MNAKQKLTKAEKRVASAKEALKLIKKGLLIPEPMTYLAYGPNSGRQFQDPTQFPADSTFEKQIKGKECEVCAVGACFVGMALSVNSIESDAGIAFPEYRYANREASLSKIFSPKQRRLIERCFEGFGCEEFFDRYTNAHDRLVAILKNIVKNQGTFRP